MSYAAKARAAVDALRNHSLAACPECTGVLFHDPNCPSLRPALLEKSPRPGAPTLEEPLTLEQVKAAHVARVLREKGWHKTRAAKALAIDRRTLYHLIDRYGIKEPPP